MVKRSDVQGWGNGYLEVGNYTIVANVMRSADYKTAGGGKLLSNGFRIEPKALEKHGFDDWGGWSGYETGNRASGKRYWDHYIHTRTGSKKYQDKLGPDIYCDIHIDFMRRHRRDPMMLYLPMALTHGCVL